jgi:hemerythrin-like domain-containing protein
MSKTKDQTDAIELLKSDHEKVKGLFEQFEDAESQEEKESIIQQAIEELKIHAQIEEEIFYPALRDEVEDDLMNEADEEHHVARVLIAELDNGVEDDEEHRNAKFTVLAESVKHHIKEEEGEIMPQAKKAEIDFNALGARLMERKNQLQESGVPDDDEHQMVSSFADGSGSSASRSSSSRTASSERTSVAGSTKSKSNSRKATPRAKRTA